MLVSGRPVSEGNLHLALPGTLGSGVLDVSSIVCSLFGISIPRNVLFLMLRPAPVQKPTLSDWMKTMPEQEKQDLVDKLNESDEDMNKCVDKVMYDLEEFSMDDVIVIKE